MIVPRVHADFGYGAHFFVREIGRCETATLSLETHYGFSFLPSVFGGADLKSTVSVMIGLPPFKVRLF
jgi:hypothetical protein